MSGSAAGMTAASVEQLLVSCPVCAKGNNAPL
jgi:hypothetical protein